MNLWGPEKTFRGRRITPTKECRANHALHWHGFKVRQIRAGGEAGEQQIGVGSCLSYSAALAWIFTGRLR